jgi:hypothetical protein
VKQGFEPPIFTCHFLGWNSDLWAQDKSYEVYLMEVYILHHMFVYLVLIGGLEPTSLYNSMPTKAR